MACPFCGGEQFLAEKSSMTGEDCRTYECRKCGKEEEVRGPAVWKGLHDHNEAKE